VLTASAANARVNLAWSGFADLNGVTSYMLVQALDTAPANCLTGTLLYRGSDASFAHERAINGKLYAYRVCAIDSAGNLSLGKNASARPAPEFDAPSGSLRINNGDAYTTSQTLSLAITASDASRISTMCISTAATCTTWVPYATKATLPVTQTSGPVKVNVWLRDEWLNASTTPFSASVGIDTKPPVLGAFVATPVSGGLRLSWAGATDTDSGVLGYRLVAAAGATAPATCQAGMLLSETLGLTFTHLVRGTYSYRVCAQDRVGNWAVGKTLKATAP
jgi:hypothetical protein